MKLWEIIKKNFKVIMRSKSSATIVFLGPLILILMIGFAFSNSQAFSLKIGTYSSQYTEITDSMVNQLRENNYQIQKFNDENSCIDGIKQGLVNACIVFPGNMKISEASSEVVFHIDYSKVNLVYILINSMMQKVTATSSNISMDLTMDIINKLNFADNQAKSNLLVIEQMADEKKTLEGKLKNIEGNMNSLNTDFNKDDFKQNEISKNLGLIKNDLGRISVIMGSYPGNAKTKIDGVLTDSNFTSSIGYNYLSTELKSAQTLIENLRLNVTASTNHMDSQITNLSTILTNLDKTLDATKKKLDDMKSSKTYTIDSINDAKSIITDIEIKLGIVRKSMNDVSSRISAIEVKDASTIVAPITTKIEPIVVEKSHFNYMFPTLIVLVLMITAVLFSATSTVVDRNSKAHFRNSIAPIPKYLFDVAHYLSSLMMIFAQAMIFSIFAAFLFKQSFLASIHTTALAIILISSLFILLGMLIGNLFNTEETAILASITLSSLMLFLSNTVLPLESLPEMIKQIAMLNPFVIAENLLRQTILYNMPISSIGSPIFLLLDFIILTVILLVVVKRFKK